MTVIDLSEQIDDICSRCRCPARTLRLVRPVPQLPSRETRNKGA